MIMFRIIGLLYLSLLYFTNAYAGPGYLMSICSSSKVSPDIYEFDICIKSTGAGFDITSYQCAFTMNQFILNGGIASFIYVPGSSDFQNIPPSAGFKLDSVDNNYEITFASMPGRQTINSSEMKVGRFRLQNSVPFAIMDPDITWNFDGILCTILTGTNFTNITNPDFHSYDFLEISKLPIASVYASAVTDSTTPPEKTIDGLGYFDGDPNSRWAAQPMPQWLMLDLGVEQFLSKTRISFYNFQSNRIYTYSISVSVDSLSWMEVVSGNNSVPSEWTDNNFTSVRARFIKLTCLSSTNNPANWANVWEFEAWGAQLEVPVELSLFNAEVLENKTVMLNWITETEKNNRGFAIERSQKSEFKSQNGFEVISFIEGKGTTTERSVYSFIDQNVLPGKYFYRLKQIDFDGTFEYSETIELNIISSAASYQLYQNYPNPFNPSTKIEFDLKEKGIVTLLIFNILGEKITELINSEIPEGKHSVEFNAANLPSGIYICSLNVKDQFSQNLKMTLLK